MPVVNINLDTTSSPTGLPLTELSDTKKLAVMAFKEGQIHTVSSRQFYTPKDEANVTHTDLRYKGCIHAVMSSEYFPLHSMEVVQKHPLRIVGCSPGNLVVIDTDTGTTCDKIDQKYDGVTVSCIDRSINTTNFICAFNHGAVELFTLQSKGTLNLLYEFQAHAKPITSIAACFGKVKVEGQFRGQ